MENQELKPNLSDDWLDFDLAPLFGEDSNTEAGRRINFVGFLYPCACVIMMGICLLMYCKSFVWDAIFGIVFVSIIVGAVHSSIGAGLSLYVYRQWVKKSPNASILACLVCFFGLNLVYVLVEGSLVGMLFSNAKYLKELDWQVFALLMSLPAVAFAIVFLMARLRAKTT